MSPATRSLAAPGPGGPELGPPGGRGLAARSPAASHAVSLGALVFVSGFSARTEGGEVAGGDDVEAQTCQVLQRLDETLVAAGSGLRDVLKLTIYLTDMTDRAGVDLARRKMFGAARPAATLVEVSGLATAGAKVEIDAIACRAPVDGGSQTPDGPAIDAPCRTSQRPATEGATRR